MEKQKVRIAPLLMLYIAIVVGVFFGFLIAVSYPKTDHWGSLLWLLPIIAVILIIGLLYIFYLRNKTLEVRKTDEFESFKKLKIMQYAFIISLIIIGFLPAFFELLPSLVAPIIAGHSPQWVLTHGVMLSEGVMLISMVTGYIIVAIKYR